MPSNYFLNFIFELFIATVGNIIDFCMLALYAVTLLNSLTNCECFLVDSFMFSIHKIMISEK